jgi:hypothetical protein
MQTVRTANENNQEAAMLTLYFADHGEEDSPELRQLFKKATIFVYEHGYRTHFDNRITLRANALAEGRMQVEEFRNLVVSSTPLDPLPSLIHDSWVKVVLEQSPLSENEIETFHRLAWKDPPETLPLAAQLNELKLTLNSMAEYDRRRDRALAGQLKRLRQENPDDKILTVRGCGHRLSLTAECRRVGENPRAVLGTCNPLVQNDVIALLAAGQQPTTRQLSEALQERRLNIRAD